MMASLNEDPVTSRTEEYQIWHDGEDLLNWSEDFI